MGRRLAYTVHVPSDGKEPQIFEAGSVPPPWAAKLITNPIAFEDSDEEDEPLRPGPSETALAGDAVLAELEKAKARIAELEAAGSSSGGSEDGDDGPPPKAGAGSGVDKWVAYAKGRGVDVADDAKRDDVIAALEKAGFPTERSE